MKCPSLREEPAGTPPPHSSCRQRGYGRVEKKPFIDLKGQDESRELQTTLLVGKLYLLAEIEWWKLTG